MVSVEEIGDVGNAESSNKDIQGKMKRQTVRFPFTSKPFTLCDLIFV
jgi:hypothetical protein